MIKKRTVRKKTYHKGRIVLIAALAVVLLGMINSGRSLLKILELTRMKKEEQRARDESILKRDSLQEEVYRLQNDSLYIEEIARREYGMLKEGEETWNITLPDTTKRMNEDVSGK